MKYNDVSLELRNKIRRDMKILIQQQMDDIDYTGILSFNNKEKHLHDECQTWKKLIDTYFSTTYDCYKLSKIGRFIGVRPHKIYFQSVTFQVSSYNNPTWEDWFDVTGENDGYLIGTVGIVINERTCKHIMNKIKEV